MMENKIFLKSLKGIVSFLLLLSAAYVGRGLVIMTALMVKGSIIQFVNHFDIVIGVLLFFPLIYLKKHIDRL